MFDSLSDRLGTVLGDLRKRGRLDEESISRAMREIRLALLDADVNLEVVSGFVARVRERALGEQVLRSLTPGQQVVKVVHDELTDLMGEGAVELELGTRSVILLAGLQGSGKTTAAAKLALRFAAEGRRPGLVAADLQRPAAADQLEQLGRQIDVPVFRTETADPVEASRAGLERAFAQGLDTVIIDTAGRLQVDEQLMDELERVVAIARPTSSLLVLDAMTGQQAADVATAFQERIAFDGVILTKLDGDARGGAALSVKTVTGRPIMFISTGERLETLEVFHPERMASRILGMGDVLSLIERAESQVDEKSAEELQDKLKKDQFTLEDFLTQMKQVRKMGPLSGILGMLPGMGAMKQLKNANIDERQLDRTEAIILSMTPAERHDPHLIKGRRRKRIADGSGTRVQEVRALVKQFDQMRVMMRSMANGKMPDPQKLMAMSGQAPRPKIRRR